MRRESTIPSLKLDTYIYLVLKNLFWNLYCFIYPASQSHWAVITDDVCFRRSIHAVLGALLTAWLLFTFADRKHNGEFCLDLVVHYIFHMIRHKVVVSLKWFIGFQHFMIVSRRFDQVVVNITVTEFNMAIVMDHLTSLLGYRVGLHVYYYHHKIDLVYYYHHKIDLVVSCLIPSFTIA